MNRTITVKGTGSISRKPDRTVVSMTLKSLAKEYDASMQKAADMLCQLQNALLKIGFREEDLKTSHFQVCTEYESVCEPNGNYKSVFSGYACIHSLQLMFDFDTDLLADVLSAVSHSIADPELSIQFTVKDPEAISDALLERASANAKQKAEVLAKASGASLGTLVSIDYSWGDRNMFSRTEYNMDSVCMAMRTSAKMQFTPDEVSLTDSATFVWELV